MTKKQTVFMGLSGGVDSAVSAALLKEQGYEVVGVFIKTWHPDFLVCNEEEERLDAMRISAYLDIPFLTFDFADVYKKEVADYMIAEYEKGKTPNPDVMCNKEVKFGAFLKKALTMGADFVATGHYAGVDSGCSFFSALRPSPEYRGGTLGRLKKETSRVNLCKGNDPLKDQSYFLWTLTQEQLKHILFPIGHLKKTEVRKLAKKFNLPVAEKKDSQGICFLGAVDLVDFLKHYIKEKKGKVLLAPSTGNEKGEEIGFHDGVFFHTLGARHGFTITKKSPNDGRYYIVGKDIKKNILYVSQEKTLKNFPAFALGDKRTGLLQQVLHGSLNSSKFFLEIKNVNWINKIPEQNKTYTMQIRYHGEFFPCQIKCQTSDVGQVLLEKPVLVASGQSVVVYDNDVCLGGGIVV